MSLKKVAVECRGVGLSYGKTEVLRDINLLVEPGEFFALLGPSGSGKSTLLRLIAGFNRANRGQVLIDGVDISGTPPHLRNVGMVFQNYALWPHLSVFDNVAFGLVERRLPKAEIRARTSAALERVGLAQFAQRRPGQLSGGQQQRVAVARTIVIEPQVLLLDEPLSNLDKGLRVTMREELRSLQRELGITTLFVTHDQEEAMTTADRMAVLDHGIVQQVGAPVAMYDFPENQFVAGFVGTANTMAATVVAADGAALTVEVAGIGPIQLGANPGFAHGSAVRLSFRPHTVHLNVAGVGESPDYVWLDGEVAASEFLGEFVRYRIRAAGHELSVDRPHLSGGQPRVVGAAVRVGIDPSQLRCLRA